MKRLLVLPVSVIVILLMLLSLNSMKGSKYENNSAAEIDTGNNSTGGSISSDPDEFLVGAYSIGCATDNKMKELGMNLWQRFLNQEIIEIKDFNQKVFFRGWGPNDALFDNTLQTSGDVIKYYNSVSELNNNFIYLTRPKIEMLTFAQRSDYHPFKIANHQPSKKGKWYYGYNTVDKGAEITDDGKYVRKCSVGENEGYVVRELRPTWEQVKEGVPNNFFRDGYYSWYVEPSVKIPANTPRGTKIFRVEIYKKDGKLFRSVDISRENFDRDGKPYDGSYIDRFFSGDNNPLFIQSGDSLYGQPENQSQSFVDYAIYWYGRCDMFLERVRVENDWAVKLFSGAYDKTWIEPEIMNIADKIKPAYKILVDESDHNMYPAIGYINDKIRKYRNDNQKLSLSAVFNVIFWIPEQRPMWTDAMNLPDVKEYFMSSGMNEVFTDLYPLYGSKFSSFAYGREQLIPNTLSRCSYDVSKGILGEPAKPENYEINLNTNLDYTGHHYNDFLRTANEISRHFDVPHIAAVQIHSWFNGNENAYTLREPTNEEIEMLCGIALTYGAKGIIYHSFNSSGNMKAGSVFSRGLVGELDSDINSQCDDPVRFHNAYGQEKWNKIISLTAKLKTLGAHVINFDNTKTHSYRYHNENERQELFANSYFSGITLFRYGTGLPPCAPDNIPQGMTYDCPEDTYLQAGIFYSSGSEPYFMLVNRRASPVKEGYYDGRRYVRIQIKPDFPAFQGYDYWKITDTETNTVVAQFNKRELSVKDIGWLMPGQMKLYKIMPDNR